LGTKSNKLMTQPQLRKIYAEARDAGISNEKLHEIVYNTSGKTSIKDLLISDAAILIDILVDFNSNNSTIKGMISDKQKWLIYDYRNKLGWNDVQLQGFIKKYAHIEHLNWLRKEDASKLIEAFKNIYSRETKTYGGH